MPKVTHEPNIISVAGRSKLPVRTPPYWRSIEPALKLGFRKTHSGGFWLAKNTDTEHGRKQTSLGAVDAMDFTQAQEAARKWHKGLMRGRAAGFEMDGPYRVKDAIKDYLAHYDRRGGKAKDRTEVIAEAHITPKLGELDCAKLTKRRLEAWLDEVASARPRLRTRKGKEQAFRDIGPDDADAIRRRRSSANRVLTVLKAALNHAYQEGRVAHDDAWKAVKPFREVDAPKIRYLKDEEVKRLVNACQGAFRDLVIAALQTGCRYGELCAMKVEHYDRNRGTLHIPISKSGKARHIALSDEGSRFFNGITAGRAGTALMFIKDEEMGTGWSHAHQFRPLKDACTPAKIAPAISFHILRHTFASRLAMKGVPMPVIATYLGHADTRMTEKHYAHLCPSYVAETFRSNFDSFGIVPESKIAMIT